MTSYKEDFIGNGGHWNVKRITFTVEGVKKSIIHKEPIKNGNTKKNIDNYKLILSSNLPTLSKYFDKIHNGLKIIEAEDLNPEKCDGLYVSPNTVRTSKNCSNEIINYLKSNNKTKTINTECKEFDFENIFSQAENIPDDIINALREKKILYGAEKDVYENKIKNISNFRDFLIQSKKDMKIASDNRVELYSDAFFFKVTDSSSTISYKIADFDCINSYKDDEIDLDVLFNGNKYYFETSLNEYLKFFVEESHKKQYINLIKSVW